MTKNLKLKKGSAMLSWVLSYLVIVVFLTIILFIVSHLYNKILKTEVEKYNLYVFETVSENISESINSIDNLKYNFLMNQKVKDLSGIASRNNLYANEAVFSIVNDLKESSKVNKLYAYLFFEKSDSVISEYGVMSRSDYFDLCLNGSGFAFEEWDNELKKKEKRNDYVFHNLKINGKEVEVVSQSANIADGVTIVVATDKALFFGRLNEANIKNRYNIGIYDRYGKLVFSDSKNIMPETFSELKRYDSEQYDLIKTVVNVRNTDWTSAMLIEKNFFARKTRGITVKIIFLVAFSLLLCIVIVWKLANRSYRPIQELKRALNIDSGNDYEEIRKKINAILQKNIEEKEIYDKELSKSKIPSLLMNKTTDMVSYQKLIEELNRPMFSVICLTVNNFDDFMPEVNNKREKLSYYKFVVENVLSELFEEKNITVYTSIVNDELVCLLNFDNEASLSVELIESILKKAVKFIGTEFNISMIWSVSTIHEGITEVHSAYTEAREILDSMILIGFKPKKIISSEFAPIDSVVLTVEKQQKLINCLQNGDEANSIEIIREVFSCVKENQFSKRYVNIILYDLICTIMKSSAIDSAAENTYLMDECVDMLFSLNEKHTIDEMYERIEQLICEWCENISEKLVNESKINKKQKRLLDVLAYINENYTSPSINISTVAIKFDLTPYYISKLFKEHTNESIMDYINRLRIEKANALFEEKKYTVNDVAEMVGFTHVKTFYRVYKKITGTTPTKMKY